MFCSVKKDKKNNRYRFYICDRHRDKETGKVKSNDKYIMSLQNEEISRLSIEELKRIIEDSFINKGINLDNIDLVMDKINILKDVVTIENTTTKKDLNNVVVQEDGTTNNKNDIEVIETEIVEEFKPSYKTTISFDVQQEFSKNVKQSLGLDSMIAVFGGKPKNEFEIEEEELNKMHDRADIINKKIEEILKEHIDIENLNSKFKALNSDISIVQDIYISCYDKVPNSEIWLVGSGYIEKIYRIEDIILPHQGNKLYEGWEEIKEEYN